MKFHDADERLGLEALKLFSTDRFGDQNYPEAAFAHLCRRNRPDSDEIANAFFSGVIGVEEYYFRMMSLVAATRKVLARDRVLTIIRTALIVHPELVERV